MLAALLIGCATVMVSMGIQVVAVVFMLRYVMRLLNAGRRRNYGFGFDIYIISMVLLMLFTGHLVQVAIWARLFMYLGEFNNFTTAFYHSMVNFAALGYGDIVMSEDWRLLGAIESSIGVLMFCLSAGIMVAVMSPLFARHTRSQGSAQGGSE